MFEGATQEDYSGFVIDDDKKAEWAMKKIAEAKNDRQMWSDYYAKQLDKIGETADATIRYMTDLLSDYFKGVPHSMTKGGKEKYKLPSGELVLTPATIDYERDNDALLKWCEENAPEYIRVKKEPAWSEIKKTIKTDGLIPDGVNIVEKPEEFKVMI